ncbi:MAG: hypothetical protein JXA50_01850 [Deltaproteobacteria bacterium]|nr:hypothetical protein [Deltaproteobacteria bacterium]
MRFRQKRTRELTGKQLKEKRQRDEEYEGEVQKLSDARYKDKTMSAEEYQEKKERLWDDYSKWAGKAGIWEVIEE